MNISASKISGDCTLKCAYSFEYLNSTCIAYNQGSYIFVKYDTANLAPVTYNENKYQVSYIILSPSSLQLYNGNKADAELLIVHSPVTSGNPLYVFVPIVGAGSSSSSASIMLSNIISGVSQSAPATGNKTTINMAEFTLQKIIPKKPFYSYTLTSTPKSVISFGIENAIQLNTRALNTLTSLFPTPPTWSLFQVSNLPLFFNQQGPNTGGSEDIYIDCQPINASEETIEVASMPMTDDYDLQDKLIQIFNSPWFQILLLLVAITILYYVVRGLLKMADTKVVK